MFSISSNVNEHMRKLWMLFLANWKFTRVIIEGASNLLQKIKEKFRILSNYEILHMIVQTIYYLVIMNFDYFQKNLCFLVSHYVLLFLQFIAKSDQFDITNTNLTLIYCSYRLHILKLFKSSLVGAVIEIKPFNACFFNLNKQVLFKLYTWQLAIRIPKMNVKFFLHLPMIIRYFMYFPQIYVKDAIITLLD